MVTADVQRFIREYVDSAEQLEILLRLHREPHRAWTAAELGAAVYTVPQAAQLRLDVLVALGFAAASPGDPPTYRYAPRDEALADAVAALAAAYRGDRVAVIKLVYDRPAADPVRSFADAFRLRKEP